MTRQHWLWNTEAFYARPERFLDPAVRQAPDHLIWRLAEKSEIYGGLAGLAQIRLSVLQTSPVISY